MSYKWIQKHLHKDYDKLLRMPTPKALMFLPHFIAQPLRSKLWFSKCNHVFQLSIHWNVFWRVHLILNVLELTFDKKNNHYFFHFRITDIRYLIIFVTCNYFCITFLWFLLSQAGDYSDSLGVVNLVMKCKENLEFNPVEQTISAPGQERVLTSRNIIRGRIVECGTDQVICGFRVKVQDPTVGDEAGIVQIKFKCCYFVRDLRL